MLKNPDSQCISVSDKSNILTWLLKIVICPCPVKR